MQILLNKSTGLIFADIKNIPSFAKGGIYMSLEGTSLRIVRKNIAGEIEGTNLLSVKNDIAVEVK